MKVAILLGHWSLQASPLDFWYSNIWTSARGLTGTELLLAQLAVYLKNMGHDISIFALHAQPEHKPDSWEGCKLYNIDERFSKTDDSFDAFISINEPDVFRGMSTKPLRFCWNMLNDFTYCQPGFDDFVDVWAGVCEMHTNHLKSQSNNKNKWVTIPLGCDNDLYKDERIPGRIIWSSSPDRGLHLLLSAYPDIKKSVPEANLRIFYKFAYDHIVNNEDQHPHMVEMKNRVLYMMNAIPKLKHLGVEHIGSVSVNQMITEMNKASVSIGPLSTIAFSEGFSIATLASHAGYSVPIVGNIDCLGSIYKNSGCLMVDSPVGKNLKQFTDYVIKALTDKPFADQVISKCRDFSQKYTWKSSISQLENIIKNHPKVLNK